MQKCGSCVFCGLSKDKKEKVCQQQTQRNIKVSEIQECGYYIRRSNIKIASLPAVPKVEVVKKYLTPDILKQLFIELKPFGFEFEVNADMVKIRRYKDCWCVIVTETNIELHHKNQKYDTRQYHLQHAYDLKDIKSLCRYIIQHDKITFERMSR